MIFELADTKKAEAIFAGWEETLITSCLQKVMGKVFVTDTKHPKSACAYVGCFAFYAGVPEKELVLKKPDGFVIMTPQNEAWASLIEECFPEARKATRYAIKKDTKFDVKKLQEMKNALPYGYELRRIDGELYDKCLTDAATEDFVSSFEVDTIESERRKHLATAACAALILECLKENLYPSWDAQNITSVHLAEKLGYEYSHDYIVYEVN